MVKKLVNFVWWFFKTFVFRIGIAYFITTTFLPNSLGTLMFIVYLLYFFGGLLLGEYNPKKKNKTE